MYVDLCVYVCTYTAGVRITAGPRARGPKNGGGAPRFSG